MLKKLILFVILLMHYTNRISEVNTYAVKTIQHKDESITTSAPPLTTTDYMFAAKLETMPELAPMEEVAKVEGDLHLKTSSLLHTQCERCPKDVLCVPQIQCPAHVRMSEVDKPQICDLPRGKFGYCCTTGQNHTAPRANTTARSLMPTVMPMAIIEQSRQRLHDIMHNAAGAIVHAGQPDFMHGMVFHSTHRDDMNNFHLSVSAMEQLLAGQAFVQQEHVPVDDVITNSIDVEFSKTPLAEHCATHRRPCPRSHTPYRTIDGNCNNPISFRSHWGAAGQPMERLLPPAYEDGMWAARAHSRDGSLLTGARDVSRILLGDAHRPHTKLNLLVMQFGQFVTHDVSQTASWRTEAGDTLQCCTPNGDAPLPHGHFACMPIAIQPDDEFYAPFHVRCMNFVRLSLAPNADCKVGYGKQRSKVTHYLDASTVYGSSEEAVRELRTFRGGKLRMFNDFGHDLLPLTNDKNICDSAESGKSCFKSGDGRTNQIISLIVLHQLFAREHNRIASALARINPHFDDETLFQESRRLVIAELQHIIYNEYLPLVVGPIEMKRFRLAPQHHGYAADYSSDVNAALMNEFSGAAFRFGHSTVDGKFHVHDGTQPSETINIPDVMFNPSRMRQRTFYDNMLNTLTSQPMQTVDSFITKGLSRFLFRGHNPFGLDLAAINIQRGRDHALRGYNDYLEVMGHRKILHFDQLPVEVGGKLARVYRHPDDIDLWVGGLLEAAVPDGAVGITFAEIIADQFSRFKRGDRYFYEYGPATNPGAFTQHQLNEIRRVTMARLICDNADHLTLHSVPPAAFVRGDFPGNQPLRCDSQQIPALNLEAWRA